MKEIKKEKSITNRNTESLERYLRELYRYPILNAAEEGALAKKIRMGDVAAMQKLVCCNLRFVVTVAKKYEVSGMSLADLISEGNIGLLKAAERFDESRGFKFISYAVWWIRQSILLSMAMNKRMIRLPTNQLKGITNLKDAERILEQRLHRSATSEELSELMEMPYLFVLDYLSNATSTSSFDVPIGDDHLDSRIDVMSDPESIHMDAQSEREALHIDIELMMSVLTVRERLVLRLAYGMVGSRPLENIEIGKQLSVSTETVRRDKVKIFLKLRAHPKIEMMMEYL